MKFKIKVNYDTGDSFHNEYGLEQYIEGDWENEDIANQNAKCIKEHYEYYQSLNSRWSYKVQKILNE